jgi:hypothetical protein
MNDKEFYIGYLPKMSKSLAKVIKTFVVLAFVAAILLVVISWFGQKPFARSFFEFGEIKDFSGTIQAEPIPFLLIETGEKNGNLPVFERFPLVSEGKFGIDVSAYKNQSVKLKGTLIYRDNLKMIEVKTASIEQISAKILSDEVSVSLGVQTLKGEIADSKCYLGVMNPGESKVHKDCAIRCLSGGIPPLFIVKDTAGNVSELWIVAEKVKFLDYVAEPVEITGEVKRQGDKLFIYLNSIKRL